MQDERKCCTRCLADLPVESFSWQYKDRGIRQPACKECVKRYKREHRAKYPDRIAAYRAANADRISAARKEHWKQYYPANREQVGKRQAAYYRANAEVYRRRAAAWAQANPDRLLEQKRAWRELNAEAVSSAKRAWREENRERVYEGNERRLARKRGATRTERVYRRIVWERDGGVCRLCLQPADPSSWHLEHLTPLSRGGDHTYDNVAVSHPGCNLAKFRRTLDEWLAMPESLRRPHTPDERSRPA